MSALFTAPLWLPHPQGGHGKEPSSTRVSFPTSTRSDWLRIAIVPPKKKKQTAWGAAMWTSRTCPDFWPAMTTGPKFSSHHRPPTPPDPDLTPLLLVLAGTIYVTIILVIYAL